MIYRLPPRQADGNGPSPDRAKSRRTRFDKETQMRNLILAAASVAFLASGAAA
ncbi:hypothetical protein ABIE08_000001, partial [Kaistia defluvii]